MIVGSSVHNQRIERLWRDMHQGITVVYYKLFYFMENHDLLDPLNEKHLYALHYTFKQRINRALSEFRCGWNNHPLRTSHHKSPYQLFTAGALLLQHSGIPALGIIILFEPVITNHHTSYLQQVLYFFSILYYQCLIFLKQ